MRREQNLALVGAVVTGAVIATGLLLLLVARVNPDGAARLRGAVLDVTTPVWSVVRAPFDGIGRGADFVGDYLGAVTRNRALEAENAALRAAVSQGRGEARALVQLRRLLAVRDPRRRVVATARIVSATPGSVVRSAMIAAGRGAGVAPGLPVLGADGLIGRVVEAGAGAARVLLLTDPASRIPVAVLRTGQSALAVGTNSPALELRGLTGPEVRLLAGDRLVTSGDGGVFPPGIPVGTVIDNAGTDSSGAGAARVRPAATPVGAGYVTIEAAYLPIAVEAEPMASATPVPIEAQRSGARVVAPAPKVPLQ